jgi:glycerol-1-phosphate dehydrogenase [NAD(P)+]
MNVVSAPDLVRDLQGLRRQLEEAPDASALRPIGLERVLLGAGVLDSLPEQVADVRTDAADVVLLADCREMAGASPDLKSGVEALLRDAGLPTRRVTIGDTDARVHVDAATIEDAVSACAGASVLVSVGSGSVVDVGKVVSKRLDELPHVVLQTAGSVNGYADDQSVLLVDGVKRTSTSRWPDRLVIDTDVLALAPPRLNCAGLGDLLASYTAPADWRLASLVGQDGSYSPAVVALTRSHVDAAVNAASGIPTGDASAIENLAAALTLSGISMGVAGRTSPGSGMEHTVSHLLEMARPSGDPPLHGAKIGVLTVLAALLWARVRAAARSGGLADLPVPSEKAMRQRVEDALAGVDANGMMAEECWRDYSRKLKRLQDARRELTLLTERWASFELELSELLVPAERLVAALRASGAPTRLSELGVDGAEARWALTHCHVMRDRFTVADLAFLMGIWEPADVDALLVEAAQLGAGL